MSAGQDLPHFDPQGASRMVDVGDKNITRRYARATGQVAMKAETQQRIRSRQMAKGDVLEVARLAGILAAKRTWELIPLCHPLALEAIEIRFGFPDEASVSIAAEVRITARTGVEMEALVAVTTAALTIYDMCKSIDRQMTIGEVRVDEKAGGRSGHYQRSPG